MKNKYTNSILALAIGVGYLVAPKFALAQYYSQTSSQESIVIDKKVRSEDQNVYFDNLTASQKVFVDGNLIEFKIIVKNAGNVDLINVKLNDVLPQYLVLLFFPGTVDKNSNTISWTMDKLAVSESKEYLIRAQISGSDKIGSVEKKIVNRVTGCTNGGICDSDTASYVVKGRTMPNTGSNELILETVMISLVAGSGFALRKVARGY